MIVDNSSGLIDLNDYECADRGLVLPLISEYTWNPGVRAFLYFIGLLWCFFGVAIVADIFMCSIEKITSHTRKIKVANPNSDTGYEEIEVRIWNDTVANLTLMALGSSAPEILLAVIEVLGNKFQAGDLGPGTIVGSAAFNLLCIIGVCIISIPKGEGRSIRAIKVFIVTAVFSLFAYIWLVLVLVVFSPDFVELWEAFLTLLFFPILVVIAYIADRDFCGKQKVDDSALELGFDRGVHGVTNTRYLPWLRKKARDHKNIEGASNLLDDGDGSRMNAQRMREFIKELRKVHPHLTEEEIAQLAAAKLTEEMPHNRLWYRINAVRALGGGHKLQPQLSEHLTEVYENLKHQEASGELDKLEPMITGSLGDLSESGAKAVIEFTAAQSAVMENEGQVKIYIRRYGKTSNRVLFRIETIDGTAEADSDYIPIKQTLIFERGETQKVVDITIIDDNEWEPDEVFFVKLSLDHDDPSYHHAVLGPKSIQEVTIVNDDEPGTFEFAKPSLLFKESCGKAHIPVERKNGADGKVEVHWKTEDMSAKTGRDYEGGEGVMLFEHGETTKTIEIPVYDDQEAEKDECFKVEITKLSEGAKLGRIKKTIVTIVNDDDFQGMVNRLVDLTNMNMDALRVESSSWGEQFRNAMNVNGGDVENASTLDYILHFVSFGFKVLFAFIPPPGIWNGWLAFFVSLGMIGLLTTFIGDLASVFGCLVGLKDSVTAITFVALGTSLPDLFASKTAAAQEKTADNSIGNVTGSNSVNVFLGLGLPWVMASIYWTSKGETFKYPAGSLSFSVVIYTICALVCIFLIMARRYLSFFGKSELGGPFGPKIACGCLLFFLWIFYVILSSLQAYGHIKANF